MIESSKRGRRIEGSRGLIAMRQSCNIIIFIKQRDKHTSTIKILIAMDGGTLMEGGVKEGGGVC